MSCCPGTFDFNYVFIDLVLGFEPVICGDDVGQVVCIGWNAATVTTIVNEEVFGDVMYFICTVIIIDNIREFVYVDDIKYGS